MSSSFMAYINRNLIKLYDYYGVPCSEDTFLLWRDRDSHGVCPWCNYDLGNINEKNPKLYRHVGRSSLRLKAHLKECPKRSELVAIVFDPVQINDSGNKRRRDPNPL
jgi:hypothetical protein